MERRTWWTAWALVLLTLAPASARALPAFPGAEGFGTETPGGRGGRVLEVTTLADSGAGSLRAAIDATGPRTIVFRVGGTIRLLSDLVVREPYLTIAGQTAPGDGILLRDAGLRIVVNDVIVRGLRVRVGDDLSGPTPSNRDAIQVLQTHHVVVDHCSVSWAIDENMSTWYEVSDVTFSWNVIAEALHDSLHTKGPHSMGLLVGDHAQRVSVHHNLFAHNNGRNPLFKGNTLSESVNNVVYNGGGTNNFGDLEQSGPSKGIVAGNTCKPGADKTSGKCVVLTSNLMAGTQVYVAGNRSPDRPDDSLDEWLVVSGSTAYLSLTPPFTGSALRATSAEVAWDAVLEGAGAIVPSRDAVDLRVVQSVLDGTGSIIDSQSEVGGWPTLAGGVPPPDGDHDGMPDAWESARGLNPADPADASGDRNGDGYTNVEEYINGFFEASPWLRITSPNGGEPLSRGITVPITWASSSVGRVRLELSLDGGGSWQALASDLPDSGAWSFTVPDAVGEEGLLRVSALADPGVFDLSDAAFRIVDSRFSALPYFGDRLSYLERTPGRWWVAEDGGDLRYFLNTSEFAAEPGDRLGEYALIADRSYDDFVLTLEARSAESFDANVSADLCLVYGYQDDQNYYYAMVNASPALSQVFRVVAGSREVLADLGAALLPGTAYQSLRLERRGTLTTLSVDGVPSGSVDDATFGAGAVGVGSYNDSVWFDEIEVTLPVEGADGGASDSGIVPDAGLPAADGGTFADAGPAPPDGGHGDAGRDSVRVESGCGCGATGDGGSLGILLAGALALAGRRRRITSWRRERP